MTKVSVKAGVRTPSTAISPPRKKSITKAAGKLFISQPSLTLSIQNLEKELGVELFERSRGAMTLTYAGRLYYDWALNTLHSREQLDLMIDVPHPDSLNYQNIVLAQEHLVLAVPERYIKELPEVSPEAQTITMDPSKATEKVVPMQYFAGLPFFMLAEPQNLAALSRRIYESAGFLPQTRMVCSRIVTALELVGCGLGIVLAPEIYSLPGYAQEGVRYFHIEPLATDQLDVRQICLVYRKSLYLHAGLKALIDLFVERTPEIYRST